jgi:hypothetical protein
MDHMTTPGTDLSPSRIGLGTEAMGWSLEVPAAGRATA